MKDNVVFTGHPAVTSLLKKCLESKFYSDVTLPPLEATHFKKIVDINDSALSATVSFWELFKLCKNTEPEKMHAHISKEVGNSHKEFVFFSNPLINKEGLKEQVILPQISITKESITISFLTTEKEHEACRVRMSVW